MIWSYAAVVIALFEYWLIGSQKYVRTVETPEPPSSHR